MTPLRIIELSLKISNVQSVGQTPLAEDTNDAFTILNSMVALWRRQKWLTYRLVDVSCIGTGSQTYSIGPGCDFDCPRPDTIESAYVRLLNNGGSNAPNNTVDFDLSLIESREDYGSITLKGLIAFPTSVFYDGTMPNGTVYIWPMPTSVYETHLLVKETLNSFPNLQDETGLPPEYDTALIWNLAAELRPMYGLQPEPTIIVKAKKALEVITGANSKIPKLKIPAYYSRGRGNGAYNTGGPREGAFRYDQDGMT